MNQLNSVIIEGNVVKDPYFTEPASGFHVADFNIGVNRSFKGKNGEWKEEVSYVEIQAMNKLADVMKEKGKKGRGIRVVGRIKQDRWKNAEGKWDSKLYVVAEHIEFKPVTTDATQNVNGGVKTEKSEVLAMKMAEHAAAEQEMASEEAIF